jgi:tetratricopeptide (TPR) repeat protein
MMPKRLRPIGRGDPAAKRYPDEMTGLLSLGRPKDGYSYDEWAERLHDHVPELIAMVLDDDLNSREQRDRAVWAPIHALRILTALGATEAAEPLLALMADDDEWYSEELPELYGAIGPVTIPLLHAYAADPAHDVAARIRATDSLEQVAKAHAEAYDEVVRILTELLDRPGAGDSADEESLTAIIIGDLADLRAVSSYEAIRRAYAEDRVEVFYISLADVEDHFGISPSLEQDADEPGVSLTLLCTACRRERNYHVERAYLDLGAEEQEESGEPRGALIIPEPVVCPKCGAVDQYRLGALEYVRLSARLLSAIGPSPDTVAFSGPDVQLIDYQTRWGHLHPRAATQRYQEELIRDPNDVTLHVDLGNAQRILGRYDDAQASYERALALDPVNVDAWMSLAQLAGLRKDFAAAIRGWEKVLALLDGAEDEEDEGIADEARRALDDLRRGVAPEFVPECAIVLDALAPEPPPARTLTVRPPDPYDPYEPPPMRDAPLVPDPGPYGKVGRNEKCPCGSGKKYKQCHGKKA